MNAGLSNIPTCPICERPLFDREDPRCPHCGADLTDPDVLAAARAGAGTSAASVSGAGSLVKDSFLGISGAKLDDGGRGLARLGAFLFAVAFVLPLAQTWRGYTMAWDELSHGPALALLFPLVAAVVGLVVGFAPGIPAAARIATLAAVGAVGLAFGLGPLGEYAFTRRSLLDLVTLAVVIAAVAGVLRIQRPGSREARWALWGAIPVALAGYLIPWAMEQRVSVEFLEYRIALDIPLDGAVPFMTYFKGVDHRAAPILFLAVWELAPLLLIPMAAAFAWPQPKDAWDERGTWLRPVVAVLLLWVTIGYGLCAFNMIGWSSSRTAGLFAARLRMVVLSLPMSLWAAFGLATIAKRWTGGRS
jgi:hypothetical protein